MAKIKGVWVFNDTVKTHFEWLNEYQIENVFFYSNGERFTDMYWYDIEADGDMVYHISYDETLAVAGYYGDISNWENEAFKTVEFDGEQEVSAEFLAWMQENATQQASGGDKITNLIGTTWRLDKDSVRGIPQEYGKFNITANGTFSGIGSSASCISSAFWVGYAQITSGEPVAFPDTVSVYVDEASDGTEDLYNVFLPITTLQDYAYEFTITGGTHISNPLFIDFINTYGTLVSVPEPEAPTVESVVADMQSLISASNRKTGKSDTTIKQAIVTLLEGYGKGEEVAEYDGSVVIEDAVKLISFTIEGTTYQAEEGMTYAQWVDSKYNTGGFYTDGTFLYDENRAKYGTVPNMTVNNVIKQGDSLAMFGGGAA